MGGGGSVGQVIMGDMKYMVCVGDECGTSAGVISPGEN